MPRCVQVPGTVLDPSAPRVHPPRVIREASQGSAGDPTPAGTAAKVCMLTFRSWECDRAAAGCSAPRANANHRLDLLRGSDGTRAQQHISVVTALAFAHEAAADAA
jgi:hypothetical protein